MVDKDYMDLQDDTGQIDFTAMRSTSCGEVIDPVILENRLKPAPNLLYGTKRRLFGQPVNQGELEHSNAMDDNGNATDQAD